MLLGGEMETTAGGGALGFPDPAAPAPPVVDVLIVRRSTSTIVAVERRSGARRTRGGGTIKKPLLPRRLWELLELLELELLLLLLPLLLLLLLTLSLRSLTSSVTLAPPLLLLTLFLLLFFFFLLTTFTYEVTHLGLLAPLKHQQYRQAKYSNASSTTKAATAPSVIATMMPGDGDISPDP